MFIRNHDDVLLISLLSIIAIVLIACTVILYHGMYKQPKGKAVSTYSESDVDDL